MRRKNRTLFRLFCFEWKKQFLKPSLWIALALFTLINFAQIGGVFKTKSLLSPDFTSATWKEAYWELYDDFNGAFTDEKIGRLMEIYRPLEQATADLTASNKADDPNSYTGNVYSDRLFFKWCFVSPMEYSYLYQGYAQGIAEKASDNKAFYESLGNDYEVKKSEQIASLFSGRRIDSFAYTEPYQHLIEYDFSAVFVLLLVLYGLCGVFVFEKEAGMDLLLPTVYHGGRATLLAKILSSFSFTAAISLWFFLADLTGFLISYGTLGGGKSLLYALKGFANTPLNCTIWQYLVLSFLLRLLGICVIGLLLLWVSRLFQNTLLPFLLGTGGTFGLLLLHYTFSGSSQLWLRIINPFSLVFSRELLMKAEFINLFSTPVPTYLAAILFALVWIATVTIILFFPNGKSQKCKKRRSCHETV